MPDDPQPDGLQGEMVSGGEYMARTLALLERAEGIRLKMQAQINAGRKPDGIEELILAKRQFDLCAAPLVIVAESQGIDANRLDKFIRTGHPSHYEHAVRVIRQLQGWVLRVQSKLQNKSAAIPKQLAKITQAEANLKAREFLLANPNATSRQLAKGIGCSLGLVSKLTAWKAVKEERDKLRPPKKPRMTRMTGKVEESAGVEDESLARLMADQEKDEEPSPLRSSQRRVKFYGK